MPQTKILYLDFDGVLNGHDGDPVAFNAIKPDCMARLNRIVRMTRCKIVISSAWRYILHGGDMTLRGFGYMMRTHGFAHPDALIGWTNSDEEPGQTTRGAQILFDAAFRGPDLYLAVDDLAFDFEELGVPHHLTDGSLGLMDEDMEEIISRLGSEETVL